MIDTKSILSSRTVWANGIGFAAFALSLLGFDVSGLDADRLAEAALQIVTASSFIASAAFRVLATKRLAG
jgi:hypothetical protein